ncbi:hypothetical protein ABPG77_005048 [Micractinium sp. CCAP 211/92]
MSAAQPPRSGGAKPARHTPIPTEWRIELPERGAQADAEFGGCRSIESGYVRGPVLGQGTYGEVYLATDLQTKEKVAAKKIKMDNEKEGFPITAIREIKILSALARMDQEHDGVKLRNNVIGLREIVRSGSHRANNFKGSIYMIFDYMDHDMTGLLERSQRENRRFNTQQIKCYLRQLFSGLALLQTADVLHRDLKNANLLVNNKGELKIADFGLARYFNGPGGGGGGAADRPMTNRVITLWYRPPELFLGADKYGTEIDMWSAGCIMFELLTGKPLFPGKDESDQMDKIFAIVGAPTEATMPGCSAYPNYGMVEGVNRWPARSRLRQHCEARGIKDAEALNLLEQLLALNPAARVHAVKAVTHAYFYTAPLPCQPADMPKWPSSHEMTMKRARHEARYGGGQPPRGQQGSGQPPAQRQRTQGQYGGAPGQGQYAVQQQQQHGHQQAQGQGYRGGGQAVQQPYRGGGSGVAPAAGGAPVAGMRIPVVGGAPMMPGQIYTPQQLQQMGVQVAQATAVGMMAPAMGQQAAYGGGMQGSMGPPPNRMGPAPGSAGMHSAQPHRYGGGAQPNWSRERR